MKFLLALLLVFQTVLPSWGATGKVIQADKVSGTDAGKNYLAQGDAEVLITGINQYNDGSVTRPVDCTGGTGGVTMARSSTSPIEDKFSWIVTKDATNRQGQGISIDFTAPKAKAMTIAAKYLVNSGTFAAGSSGSSPTDSDLIFYVYDVTNSRLIEPSTFRLYSNQTSTDEPYSGEFQTNSDSSSYRLCLHVATTSASAWSLKLDDIEVKRSKYAAGTPISDWASYTPTLSWTSGVSINSAHWRRLGDSIEIQGHFELNGAPTAADLTVSIPSGLTIDTTKLTNGINLKDSYGTVNFLDSGNRFYVGGVTPSTTTKVTITHTESGNFGTVNATNPFTFGSADGVGFNFKVPIVGWSSSVQMSDGYDGQVVSLLVDNRTTPQTGIAPNFNSYLMNFADVKKDTVGGWNGTNTYTVKSSGQYKVSGTISITGTNVLANRYIAMIFKNGSEYERGAQTEISSAGKNFGLGFSSIVDCIAGDTISIQLYGAGNNSVNTLSSDSGNLSIEKLPGSATMSATETVSALYTGAPPAGTISAAWNTITYGTKVKDSHGAYASGTYTVPSSGQYDISAQMAVTGTYGSGTTVIISVFVDGVEKYRGDVQAWGTTSNGLKPQVNAKSVPLLAGQLLTIKSFTGATGTAFTSNAQDNFFSITRSGGY